MDLEVVGRHAMLFDDDAMAAFANSGDALVKWNSLSIDRYDVRHLLSSPLPERRRNRKFDPSLVDELALEAELDHQRYLDLPVFSDEPDPEKDGCESSADYRAVAFSYGNSDDSAVPKDGGAETGSSEFHPPFSVPGDIQSLPESDKAHQIIARTALFVSKHGGQSEIILRVKQGDNPTFGFLMPGHELHAYFRYLVDHPQLVSESQESSSDNKLKNDVLKQNASNSHSRIGALSLLGSVYGAEEDDDSADLENAALKKINELNDNRSSQSSSKIEIKADLHKEKLHSLKISSVTAPKSGRVKGLSDKPNSGSIAIDISKSDVGVKSKMKPLVLEPPPELQRLIKKIVEYIIRNGKQFEAMIVEQDREHGRFPFLLPSNEFHAYYLKILQESQKLKVAGKGSSSHKDDNASTLEKNGFSRKEKDSSPLQSGSDDILFESEKKEKFKMVINRSKKDITETEYKASRGEPGYTVDAAAAAAILQAVTRGTESSIISRSSPVDHSSVEVHVTKEQKLKAERLKRAKDFVATLKNREVPSKTGQSRCSSVEPLTSGRLKTADEDDHSVKDRKSTSYADAGSLDSVLSAGQNYFSEQHGIATRKYRARPEGCEDIVAYDGDIKEDSVRSETERGGIDDVKKNHTKRHREQYSSEEENGDHKHHSSKYRSHRSDQEDEYKDQKDAKPPRKKSSSHRSSREHSRRKHSSIGDAGKEYEIDDRHGEKKRSRNRERHKHKTSNSRRVEQSKHHSKHPHSSDDEQRSLDEHKKERYVSPAGGVHSESKRRNTSQETSVDALTSLERAPSQPPVASMAEVPDDLRAKIRAMLIATRL